MAAALRTLRLRAGPAGDKITTAAAAANLGVTRQTWEKYEGAKADVILRQDVQAAIAKALGVPIGELQAAYTRALIAEGFSPDALEVAEVAPSPFLWDMGAHTRRMVLEDDTLRPWAGSGAVIVYDPAQWPRPEDGCVVELPDGQRLVKIFVRADADSFQVAELSPERREQALPRQDTRVYRVVARIT